jgi:hypothetical protein
VELSNPSFLRKKKSVKLTLTPQSPAQLKKKGGRMSLNIVYLKKVDKSKKYLVKTQTE